jgi:hypothetical protein
VAILTTYHNSFVVEDICCCYVQYMPDQYQRRNQIA